MSERRIPYRTQEDCFCDVALQFVRELNMPRRDAVSLTHALCVWVRQAELSGDLDPMPPVVALGRPGKAAPYG